MLSSMESLAIEIFDKIFSYVNEPRDLLNLRLVNGFFNTRFAPLAFRKVKFMSSMESARRFDSLRTSGLAHLVTEITWDHITWAEYRRGKNEFNTFFRSFSTGLRAFPTFSQFRNVRSMLLRLAPQSNFTNHPRYDMYRLELQNHILTALAGIHGAVSLTNLTITNLELPPCDSLLRPEFQKLLSGLKSLSIDVAWPGGRSLVFPLYRASSPTFAEIWLKPIQETLESLSIRSHSGYFKSLGLKEAGIDFKRLTELHLHGFPFSPDNEDSDIERFIISESIASTLKILMLQYCVMIPAAHDGSGTWADTLDRFRARLKHLKYFLIGPFAYITRNNLLGDSYLIRDSACRIADAKARDKLWDSIGQQARGAWEEPWCANTFGEIVRVTENGSFSTKQRCEYHLFCNEPGINYPCIGRGTGFLGGNGTT